MFFCLFACFFCFCLNLSHLSSCILQIQTKFCVSDNTTEQPKPSILKAHRKWYRPQWKASEESLWTKDEAGWTKLTKHLSLEISVVSWGNNNVRQVFAVHLKLIIRIYMKKNCQMWWCTFVDNSGAGEKRQADSGAHWLISTVYLVTSRSVRESVWKTRAINWGDDTWGLILGVDIWSTHIPHIWTPRKHTHTHFNSWKYK